MDLSAGECLASFPGAATEVESVPAVPCEEPHAGEVDAQFELEDAAEHPGDDEVGTLADEGCATRFEEFVGIAYAASRLELLSLHPTSEWWDAADDREVSSILTDPRAR